MIVIDGMSDFYRHYYKMQKVIGEKSAGFFGMIRGVFSYKEMDDDVRVIWEGKSTIRKEMNADYKANRKPMQDGFYEQLKDTKIFLSNFFKQYQVVGYESDDMCATIAAKREKEGKKTMIVSGDDDLHQMINENTCIYNATKKEIYTLKHPKYTEVEPYKLIGWWALEGDASDNIIGVKRLRNREKITDIYFPKIEYDNCFYMDEDRINEVSVQFVKNILEDKENILSEKDKQKVEENKDNIIKNIQLIQLRNVSKENYKKIEKNGNPKELIYKYNTKSLLKYLEME